MPGGDAKGKLRRFWEALYSRLNAKKLWKIIVESPMKEVREEACWDHELNISGHPRRGIERSLGVSYQKHIRTLQQGGRGKGEDMGP